MAAGKAGPSVLAPALEPMHLGEGGQGTAKSKVLGLLGSKVPFLRGRQDGGGMLCYRGMAAVFSLAFAHAPPQLASSHLNDPSTPPKSTPLRILGRTRWRFVGWHARSWKPQMVSQMYLSCRHPAVRYLKVSGSHFAIARVSFSIRIPWHLRPGPSG